MSAAVQRRSLAQGPAKLAKPAP